MYMLYILTMNFAAAIAVETLDAKYSYVYEDL